MTVADSTLIGSKFSRLTVVSSPFKKKHNIPHVRCRCDCGVEKDVGCYDLKSGNTKSCGCLKSDGSTAYATHGHTRKHNPSRTYRAYQNMVTRCNNKKSPRWGSYGGRGIKICERWLESFNGFLADMGDAPIGLTLDRIDVNGDYEPNNCRWATDEQQYNNKQSSHFVEFNGERLTISQWAIRLNINVNTLYSRLKSKWTAEKAFTTPAILGRNQYD